MTSESGVGTIHVLQLPSFYSSPWDPVAGSFFRDQARALFECGLKVGVLACPDRAPWQPPRLWTNWPKGVHWEDDDGIQTVRVYHRRIWPGRGWLRYRSWLRDGVKAFDRYAEQQGLPDILHVHVSDPAGLLGAQIKSAHGIRLVLTEHASWLAYGPPNRKRNRLAAVGIRAADAAIAVSDSLANALRGRLPEPKGGWRCIPNCVSPEFLDTPLCEPQSPAERPFTFLSVGNLVPVKGHEVLLRAFQAAFAEDPEVRLRIGGKGRLLSDLRALSQRLGIGDRVQFLGALGRDEVLWEMDYCHALVLPSLYETFGVVLAEALARGRPVVASRCGGPNSIVSSDVGLLVAPGNVQELAAALVRMHKSAASYSATRLRQSVASRFSPARVAQDLCGVYDGVLRQTAQGNDSAGD